MRVRMKTSLAGPEFSAMPGEEVDVPDADAKRLIERDMAEEVKPKRREPAPDRTATPETTTRTGAPETTTRRSPKPARRGVNSTKGR